jgi:hypothetical protein
LRESTKKGTVYDRRRRRNMPLGAKSGKKRGGKAKISAMGCIKFTQKALNLRVKIGVFQ